MFDMQLYLGKERLFLRHFQNKDWSDTRNIFVA